MNTFNKHLGPQLRKLVFSLATVLTIGLQLNLFLDSAEANPKSEETQDSQLKKERVKKSTLRRESARDRSNKNLSCLTNFPKDKFNACFFSLKEFQYHPNWRNLNLLTAIEEKNIDHDSNNRGGFGVPGVPEKNFLASWQGKFNFNSCNYLFNTTFDDGLRIYIDGKRVFNSWKPKPATPLERNFRVKISKGQHTIRAEYFQTSGRAVAKIFWKGLEGCQVEPINTPTSTPTSTVTSAPITQTPTQTPTPTPTNSTPSDPICPTENNTVIITPSTLVLDPLANTSRATLAAPAGWTNVAFVESNDVIRIEGSFAYPKRVGRAQISGIGTAPNGARNCSLKSAKITVDEAITRLTPQITYLDIKNQLSNYVFIFAISNIPGDLHITSGSGQYTVGKVASLVMSDDGKYYVSFKVEAYKMLNNTNITLRIVNPQTQSAYANFAKVYRKDTQGQDDTPVCPIGTVATLSQTTLLLHPSVPNEKATITSPVGWSNLRYVSNNQDVVIQGSDVIPVRIGRNNQITGLGTAPNGAVNCPISVGSVDVVGAEVSIEPIYTVLDNNSPNNRVMIFAYSNVPAALRVTLGSGFYLSGSGVLFVGQNKSYVGTMLIDANFMEGNNSTLHLAIYDTTAQTFLGTHAEVRRIDSIINPPPPPQCPPDFNVQLSQGYILLHPSNPNPRASIVDPIGWTNVSYSVPAGSAVAVSGHTVTATGIGTAHISGIGTAPNGAVNCPIYSSMITVGGASASISPAYTVINGNDPMQNRVEISASSNVPAKLKIQGSGSYQGGTEQNFISAGEGNYTASTTIEGSSMGGNNTYVEVSIEDTTTGERLGGAGVSRHDN